MNRTPMDETEEITEEDEYVNGPVRAVGKGAASPVSDQRSLSSTRSLPLIAVCWLILLLITGLRLHFTSVISEHDAKLTAENQNLREHNENLTTQNQQLKTEKNILTEQVQTVETNCIELNINRAQWSIDAYCPKTNNVRQCRACQAGWELTSPSCYLTHNVPPSGQITWEQARANCRGRNADLVVAHNQQEKDLINRYSWPTPEDIGYWIGLRVEGGRWKWIDGSDLTQTSWIAKPTEGHCAVSIHNQRWKSVMCEEDKRWICTQKALTL